MQRSVQRQKPSTVPVWVPSIVERRWRERREQSPRIPVLRSGPHHGHFRSTAPIWASAGATPAMPARTAPRATHMGSRVLLSQDLRASKFSMIILETIHRGPEAGHTPELVRVAATAAAPSSARRPSAWAAVGGAGGRSPRVELAQQPGGAAAGRAPTCWPGASRRRTPARG